MANKKFGDTLRELRNSKGYTQQQVADMLGLKNKSTLGSWEVGKSEPDGYTFLKLLNLYEVEDIYVTFGEVSSRQSNIDNTDSIIEKYNQLKDGYKSLIKNIIDQLLELQHAEEQNI